MNQNPSAAKNADRDGASTHTWGGRAPRTSEFRLKSPALSADALSKGLMFAGLGVGAAPSGGGHPSGGLFPLPIASPASVP